MSNVLVTNKGSEPFVGRFDGKGYEFPVGKEVKIPEIVAGFLFAYGLSDADRGRVLVRNNWLRTGAQDDEYGPKAAAKRLQSFVFKAGPDDPSPPKPKAIVLGENAKPKRELGGISKVNPEADLDAGMQTKRPRETIKLPGNRAPLLPPA